MPDPDEQNPALPGGPPAERLREFLRERLPPGTPREELNPEKLKENSEEQDKDERNSD